MKRLTGFEHHIVGGVNDIVDSTDAAGFEPVAQPGRRWCDPDVVYEPRRIARAEFGIVNLKDDTRANSRVLFGYARLRRFERGTGQSRNFARNTGKPETVAPVRRDGDFEQPVFAIRFRFAQRSQCLHLEARHSKQFGKRLRRTGEIDKFFKPVESEFHRIGVMDLLPTTPPLTV